MNFWRSLYIVQFKKKQGHFIVIEASYGSLDLQPFYRNLYQASILVYNRVEVEFGRIKIGFWSSWSGIKIIVVAVIGKRSRIG